MQPRIGNTYHTKDYGILDPPFLYIPYTNFMCNYFIFVQITYFWENDEAFVAVIV